MGSPRHKTEVIIPSVANSIVDGIIQTITMGSIKPSVEIKMTDTKTGETQYGSGSSKHTAENDAHSKFKK